MEELRVYDIAKHGMVAEPAERRPTLPWGGEEESGDAHEEEDDDEGVFPVIGGDVDDY